MSDRCYLKVYIHGYFKDMEALNEVIEAIKEEGLSPDMGGYNGDPDGILKHFADYLGGEIDCPQFYDDECNYANIQKLDITLQSFGIAYMVDHDAGSEYPAACRTWVPGEQHEKSTITANGEAMIALGDLKRLVDTVDPLAALNELILETEQAMGMDMPVCDFAPEVQVELAKVLACKVLGVGDEGRAA